MTKLYNLYHSLISEHFHHPQNEIHIHQAITLHALLCQPLATMNLLSDSMDLSILDILYKRNLEYVPFVSVFFHLV